MSAVNWVALPRITPLAFIVHVDSMSGKDWVAIALMVFLLLAAYFVRHRPKFGKQQAKKAWTKPPDPARPPESQQSGAEAEINLEVAPEVRPESKAGVGRKVSAEARAEVRQKAGAEIRPEVASDTLETSRFTIASALRAAIKLEPQNADLHLALGQALQKEEKWDEAIAEYRETLRLNPEIARAHYLLGITLEMEGEYQEALREFRAAHNLEPQNSGYRKKYDHISWALDPKKTNDAKPAEPVSPSLPDQQPKPRPQIAPDILEQAADSINAEAKLPEPIAPPVPDRQPELARKIDSDVQEQEARQTADAEAGTAKPADSALNPRRNYRFQITSTIAPLRIFKFTNPMLKIGRGTFNDLVLGHTSVSRQHARIIQSGHVTVVSDVGSSNGTFVNNVKVHDRRLEHGDCIRIGVFNLRYEATLEAQPNPVGAATAKSDEDILEFDMHLESARELIAIKGWEAAIAECREALRISPESGDAHAYLGWALTNTGKREEGIGEYYKAYHLDVRLGDHPYLAAALGLDRDSAGRTPEKRQDLPPYPGYYTMRFHLGWCTNWSPDIQAHFPAVRDNPNGYLAQFQLGVALEKRRDWKEAIARYREALRRKPDFHDAHVGLARALGMNGNWDEAASEYREIARRNPDNAQAHQHLAWALGAKGDLNGTIAEYRQSLRLSPDSHSLHFELGRVLENKKDWDGAIAEYRQALRADPNARAALPSPVLPYMGLVHLHLGRVLTRKEDWDEAIAEFRKALRLNPNNFFAHLDLGFALDMKKDWDGSVAEYRKALRLNQNSEAAIVALGVALGNKGDWDGALAQYHQTLRRNPANEIARINLGVALGHKGDWNTAVAEYREALRLNPKHEIARMNLGAALQNLGDLEGAMAEYREVLRLNPNNIRVHYLRGTLLEKEGNFEEALREYRVAHNLDPENSEYRQNCERVAWALPTQGSRPF